MLLNCSGFLIELESCYRGFANEGGIDFLGEGLFYLSSASSAKVRYPSHRFVNFVNVSVG